MKSAPSGDVVGLGAAASCEELGGAPEERLLCSCKAAAAAWGGGGPPEGLPPSCFLFIDPAAWIDIWWVFVGTGRNLIMGWFVFQGLKW